MHAVLENLHHIYQRVHVTFSNSKKGSFENNKTRELWESFVRVLSDKVSHLMWWLLCRCVVRIQLLHEQSSLHSKGNWYHHLYSMVGEINNKETRN